MTLETLIDFFKDKSVIIVGNSVESMNYNNAEFIDSHDIVIRMGRGIDTNDTEKLAIGKKLDVWVTGAFRSRMINIPKFKDILNIPILFNRSRKNINLPLNKIDEIKHAYDMFTDEEVNQLNESLGINPLKNYSRRLSTGIITIKFICEKIKSYKSLSIIGFDFFAKSTNVRRADSKCDPCSWHLPIAMESKETHWHEQEVSIVNKYIENGLLKWIVLSDLKKEVINTTKYGRF